MNDRTDIPPEVAAALAKPVQRILDKIKKETDRITIEHDARTMETELALEMTTAPSVSELAVWMRRMLRREKRRLEAMDRTKRSRRKSAGSTGFLLGGLVGLGIGLSGDDD